METNYELKNKRILVPPKAVWMVLALVLFGLFSFAQQSMTMKVANDQQMREALENPSVNSVVFGSGFNVPYSIDYLSSIGVMRAPNGSRSGSCIYWIQEADTCFWDPDDDNGWVHNFARAGSIDWLTCLCCPGDDEGSWQWMLTNLTYPPPPGGNLEFVSSPLSEDTMEFRVDHAGVYTLRYTWGLPYNSYAQTEYKFFTPYIYEELSADSVCGLCTDVNVTVSSYYGHYNANWYWKLINDCTGDTTYLVEGVDFPPLEELTYFDPIDPLHPVTNDTLQQETFEVCADYYGTWKLVTYVEGGECFSTYDTIWIEFSIEPVADAGQDAEVCDDECYMLMGSAGWMFYDECLKADNFEVTWVQIGGPAGYELEFDNANAETTYVCREEGVCSYGQYEIEFQVVNGECYDSDTMLLNFYEQPYADAGLDQHLCDVLCFTLDANPFPYCSDPIGDEREDYWEFLGGPAGVNITSFGDSLTEVCVQTSECPWGKYSFVWHEVNGTCFASDTVDIYLYQQPYADAGENGSMCYYEGCFTLYGEAPEYCSDTIGYRNHAYFVTGPEGIEISAYLPNPALPYEVAFCPEAEEGECIWGEYMIVLWETNNGVCEDYDTVYYFLFEPPTADAGDDFEAECFAECFQLGATPYSYCSDPAPEWGERYGEWTKVAGPAEVTFDDPNSADAIACPDTNAVCPWGVYEFVWTEYNGDCEDSDTMTVISYEPPTAMAGEDAEYCIDAEQAAMEGLWFTFDATPYEYCQEDSLDNYSYWSKCGGPGYVTWYENENNPAAWVEVSCFGCYCFVYHEVNGTCESTDTVHVCFYEHPYLNGEDRTDSTCIEEFPFCYDLGQLEVEPYIYGECEDYNHQGWVMTSGAGTPTYDPSAEDPDAIVCVDQYGCYSFEFIQWNGMEECADTVKADLWLFEMPEADAGDDAEICGQCLSLSAIPYDYVEAPCHPAEDHRAFWTFFDYIAPEPYCDTYFQYYPCFTISSWTDPGAEVCICDDDYLGLTYGTYIFVWTEINGECTDTDTVELTFKKVPDPLPISGCSQYPQYCGGYGPDREGIDSCGCVYCWMPEDGYVEVCANTYAQYCIDWYCLGQSTGYYGPIPGYTYEWSFTGPAGSYFNASPLYYDCECGWMGSSCVNINFGECCDTARLYLTITTPEGCETTEEWKFYVKHGPDATISGPEIAEVSSIFEYSIPDPMNPCYLYTWDVQHCGEIVYGQGTGTIGVHWTDYNENGGWGLVSVTVTDTCTCCCNTDELLVRVLPQYTLGEGALEGYVYYNNAGSTPLNGVKLTLWNGGVPVFETYSFNDIEGANGLGYYVFDGINETQPFELTAEYDAPWCGGIYANSTDALAVELQTLNPTWTNPLWIEAGDVNNSGALNSTDALWIKQRAIAMVNHFPAGDWAFTNPMAVAAGTYDVYTLSYGDVTRNYIPSSGKDMPAVALYNDGYINVTEGELFDLPIRVADAVTLGAITLQLEYNSALLEVVEVTAVEGALSNATNGNIALAWSDVNPLVLNSDDVIVTLKLKALGPIASSDVLFSIGMNTEFADPAATVLDNVNLKAFGITTDPAATDYFLSYNRPNPFSTYTNIEYTLPESGKVRLTVVDLLGQELSVMVEQTQAAGTYTVKYDAAGMAPGVYIYKITVEGESRNFVETRRMVISQ